jgi:DNA-binding FrmR family transcriptional regulator
MTQTEQDKIAADTMKQIRAVGDSLKRDIARVDERNGKMTMQQAKYQKGRAQDVRDDI